VRKLLARAGKKTKLPFPTDPHMLRRSTDYQAQWEKVELGIGVQVPPAGIHRVAIGDTTVGPPGQQNKVRQISWRDSPAMTQSRRVLLPYPISRLLH
jgi:hypothetical protein